MDVQTDKVTDEQKPLDWISEELGNVNVHADFDELPSMKFEPGKKAVVEVDFSSPFPEWSGDQGGKKVTKKIVPVTHNGERKNWWLNVRNPTYHELLELGKSGKSKFEILQTGTQANTRYTIIKE